MRIVATSEAQAAIEEAGNVYLWVRARRCCSGRQYLLEASTERPRQAFEARRTEPGYTVWTTPGLAEPDEVHLECDRRGRLRAFWNGQPWIGG